MYIKKIKTDKENKAVVVTTGERERGGRETEREAKILNFVL